MNISLNRNIGYDDLHAFLSDLKERNEYYSLLFENGKVYLIDDYLSEDIGRMANSCFRHSQI